MTKEVLKKDVKLVGGPMDGRTVAVPRSAEVFNVGRMWQYQFAGKEDRQELFAIVPTSRRVRKFIRWYVGKHGKDPRIEGRHMKQTPVRNPHRLPKAKTRFERALKRYLRRDRLRRDRRVVALQATA